MRRRRALAGTAVATLTLVLAGCRFPGLPQSPSTPGASTSASAAADPGANVQFTHDGTYQSHTGYDGVDFVLTAYPSKQTPRTHEWYARGKKYFNWTFQAYDLRVPLRAPFESKRKVYLDTVRVTSTLTPRRGAGGGYHVSARAQRITFDPQPATGPHGMLITSPKGSLELRNQFIPTLPMGTTRITLHFRLVAWVEGTPTSPAYTKHVISEQIPIEIYPGRTRTVAANVPVDAS